MKYILVNGRVSRNLLAVILLAWASISFAEKNPDVSRNVKSLKHFSIETGISDPREWLVVNPNVSFSKRTSLGLHYSREASTGDYGAALLGTYYFKSFSESSLFVSLNVGIEREMSSAGGRGKVLKGLDVGYWFVLPCNFTFRPMIKTYYDQGGVVGGPFLTVGFAI